MRNSKFQKKNFTSLKFANLIDLFHTKSDSNRCHWSIIFFWNHSKWVFLPLWNPWNQLFDVFPKNKHLFQTYWFQTCTLQKIWFRIGKLRYFFGFLITLKWCPWPFDVQNMVFLTLCLSKNHLCNFGKSFPTRAKII